MTDFLILKDKGIINSDYLNEEIINLLDQTFEIPQDFLYNVIKVDRKYIARPDLLSYDVYGDDTYSDIICKLNGISNPFELNEGDIIVIPNNSQLDKFFVFPNEETTIIDDSSKNVIPVAKTKQEKRRPNAAIVGDKRFTIDTKKRIIIY